MKVNYRIVLPSTVTAVTFQAIRAGSERNHTAEAYHLLKAKKWNRSHSVVMQHVASDAVVNGNRSHYILHCDNELFWGVSCDRLYCMHSVCICKTRLHLVQVKPNSALLNVSV